MKYCIYCRTATNLQGAGLSVSTQLEGLIKLAKRRRLCIEKVFVDFGSAKNISRQGFNSMIDEISSGKIQGILTLRFDRLSRDLETTSKLVQLKSEGKLKSIVMEDDEISLSPYESLTINVIDTLQQFEKDMRSFSIKKGAKGRK
ncbi:recombinase family protein [Candidatus Dojkabacteria bacterium]|nr:recombinase family protein [Candidatus Dojkabacteria bacterium]